MTVYLDIAPVSKPRMTRQDKWKGRKCVLDYYDFKDELTLLWGNKEVPEQISLVFHVPMPKSWSDKKKNTMLNKPHQQKPDIDNLVKAFFDCLLTDDSHIYNVSATKLWGYKGVIEVGDLNKINKL